MLYCPLIAQSNAGNDESMVRWVKKSDGTYEYDFSILDKYLDLAEKHMGKPRVLVCNVWDWYMGGTGSRVGMYRDARHAPPLVTVLDRATGKTQNVAMLDYFDPSAKAQWKPLFDQLKERMQKRGLEKAVMLGMSTDNWAYREQVEFLKETSGDLPWVNAGHYTRPSFYDGLAHYGYQASLFGYRFDYLKSRYGWNLPRLETLFERYALDGYPTSRWRNMAEQAIFGNMRGIGRLGADTWRVVKDAKGNRFARALGALPRVQLGLPQLRFGRAGAGPRRRRGHRPLRGPPRGAPGVRGPRRHRAGPRRQGPRRQGRRRLGQERPSPPGRAPEGFLEDCGPPAGRAQPRVRRSARLGLAHLVRPSVVRAVRLARASEKLYSLAGEVARKLEGR